MTYLILRLASLGNVAMTVPVITSLSRRHPNDRFVVVSKKSLGAMFYGLDNVVYHEAKFNTNGLGSILMLFRELRQYNIDVVIDLHDVIRTRILRLLFALCGKHSYVIRYGRAEKRAMIMKRSKNATPLKSEFERYRDTFRDAGLDTDDTFTTIPVCAEAKVQVEQRFGTAKGQWIGIAPFAKSKSNMLPYPVTKQLIQHYSSQPGKRVFLFGAGAIECEMLRQWASIFPNVVSVAGMLPLEQELELMRQLSVMICMDSANQHLSSLVNLRAVSIWCGTHPHLGFRGWKQQPTDIIQRHDLACRPCTVHGTNHCKYRNFVCREISAQDIIQIVDNNK